MVRHVRARAPGDWSGGVGPAAPSPLATRTTYSGEWTGLGRARLRPLSRADRCGIIQRWHARAGVQGHCPSRRSVPSAVPDERRRHLGRGAVGRRQARRLGLGRHLLAGHAQRRSGRSRPRPGRPGAHTQPPGDRERHLLEERRCACPSRARGGRPVGRVRVLPGRMDPQGPTGGPDRRRRPAAPRKRPLHRRPPLEPRRGRALCAWASDSGSRDPRPTPGPPPARRQGRPRAEPSAPVPAARAQARRPAGDRQLARGLPPLVRHPGIDPRGLGWRGGPAARVGAAHQSAQLHQTAPHP